MRIGSEIAGRKYIDCEIEKSISRGNGMLGVITHTLDVPNGKPAGPARSLAQRFAYLPTGTSAAALALAPSQCGR